MLSRSDRCRPDDWRGAEGRSLSGREDILQEPRVTPHGWL